ncbi:DUF5655 domain-containing protein [Hyphomicrobium sp. D-2]|uniref:DUF5655 domain-containing protein n=1 Tax=Hyphomicrobium sp. D-2 TaxID=3041621 RepID=UPI0024583E9F|nr:DUF5655 domain-containing protein [Hyphomicrobium sp. D-2]MDH4982807.1 DUF5655 domain-containing protein [Hyphomicrobium sp. D-2]
MTKGFGEKERTFLDGLEENTGRNLQQWMHAIAQSGQTERNDIIDWLRHEGLMFSKASWLERIHHNGGRPIYAEVAKEEAPRRPAARRRREVLAPSSLPAAPTATVGEQPSRQPTENPSASRSIADGHTPLPEQQPPQSSAPTPERIVAPPRLTVVMGGAAAGSAADTSPPSDPAAARAPQRSAPSPAATGPRDIDSVLAKAKAYRPLAQLILARIKGAVPKAPLAVQESSLSFGSPAPFAVLGITGKELRLHLALGDHPTDDFVRRGQAGGGVGKGEALSHMLVLTDARQIDQRFSDLLARASGTVST